MSTEYTKQEIADAQEALDFHALKSEFWESRTGQDHLRVIIDLNLFPKTRKS